MPDTEQIELAVTVISLALFLSSEVLSFSKCDANGVMDLLTRALKVMHASSIGDVPAKVPSEP